MPTYVTSIELTGPLNDIALPLQYNGALVLLRHANRPVGMLRLTREAMTKEALQKAIAPYNAAPAKRPSLIGNLSPISIIVCTHERPADLARCLAALAPAAERGHEIIVVDNAPRSGQTAQVAAQFPYRYLVEPRQGLDYARNCGLHAASHPLVAYSDDDAVVEPDWAEAITAPFADPEVGCVTGLVMPLELESAAQEQFEHYCLNRRIFEQRTYQVPHTPASTAGVAGMGANMALRRELALRNGGFDPRLGAGMPTCSGDETDMFAQILDSGAKIIYTPDALVWHRHRQDMASLQSCIFGYGVGLYSFLTKRIIEQGDGYALITAARWWVGPLVKAAWRALRGQPIPTIDLLLREAAGAFFGPLRLWQATIQTRKGIFHHGTG
jgi:GT2 family glycosyltransferase